MCYHAKQRLWRLASSSTPMTKRAIAIRHDWLVNTFVALIHCDNLNERPSQSRYLDTRPSAGRCLGRFGRCGLAGGSSSLEVGSEVLWDCHFAFALSASCFLFKMWAISSKLPAPSATPTCCHIVPPWWWWTLTLWNQKAQVNSSFYNLPWSWCLLQR